MKNNDRLKEAKDYYQRGRWTSKQCADYIGVGHSTFKQYIRDDVTCFPILGSKRHLTDKAERSLAKFVREKDNMGMGLSPEAICIRARQMWENNPANRAERKQHTIPSFTHTWASRFMKQHGFSVRVSETISRGRRDASTTEMARSLYDVLKNIDSQYVQGPADIYYMDEIGGRLVRQRSLNTVAPKGAKHPRTAGDLRSDDSKVARQLVACANGAGHVIPPFWLVKGNSIPETYWHADLPNESILCPNKSGKMTSEDMRQWFDHFLKHAVPKRPLTLLMDNGAGHRDASMLLKAADNNISIIYLPAHTTHLWMPIDTNLGRPYNRIYDSLVKGLRDRGAQLFPDMFFRLSAAAYYEAFQRDSTQKP